MQKFIWTTQLPHNQFLCWIFLLEAVRVATSFQTKIWIDQGILKLRGIDKSSGFSRARADMTVPLVTGQINEIVVTVNPNRSSISERIIFIVNGVKQSLTNNSASSNFRPWTSYQRVHIGGYDDGFSSRRWPVDFGVCCYQ